MDGDGRRGRPAVADRGLGRPGHLEIGRVRQAVADQGRLERDDRPAVGERGRDIGGDDEAIGKHRPKPTQFRRRLTGCGERRPAATATHGAAATLRRMPTRRPFTPEDIRRQVVVEEHRPVRRRHVWRSSVDAPSAATATSAHLWAVPLAARGVRRGTRRLTSGIGQGSDGRRLSPDGGLVAFIRRLPDEDRHPEVVIVTRVRRWRPGPRAPGRRSRARSGVSPGRRTGPVSPSRRRSTRPGSSSANVPARSPRKASAEGGRATPTARRITRTDWRMRRERAPRPLVAPVRRRRRARRAAAAGHRGRLGRDRHRLEPGRPDRGVHRGPRPGAGPPSADDDLGRRRRRRRRPEPREVLAPAGYASLEPGLLPRRPLAGGDRRPRGRPARRREPDPPRRPGGRLRAAACDRRRPRPADRQLGRPDLDGLDGRRPARARLARVATGSWRRCPIAAARTRGGSRSTSPRAGWTGARRIDRRGRPRRPIAWRSRAAGARLVARHGRRRGRWSC